MMDNLFPVEKEKAWVNKQRTLLVCSKNISEKFQQLMLDLSNLLPHTKKESKLEKYDTPEQVRELCHLHSCRSFLYFESHRKYDMYLWVGRYPNGPSIKYHVENLHNCEDLKLEGNCIKGSRPILSFDGSFNDQPFQKLQKELFIHAFNVPKHHPKSSPCVDRVFSWFSEGNQINLRQYEIRYEKAGKEIVKNTLVEIGPRILLKPLLILEGCLRGSVLFKDDEFTTLRKKQRKDEDQLRVKKKQKREEVMKMELKDEDNEIFDGQAAEWAEEEEVNPSDDFDSGEFQQAKVVS